VTSWLSKATAGVGGGSTLLNQSYLEDKDGNITQRQDNNLGLTESFGYDADNRITCAALSSSCTGTSFAYDGGSAGAGNLTTQAGVGTYTYPAAGQPRPHAVSSITGTFLGVTNPSFSYDANGNMTARASSSANILWSSYNYPTSISATDPAGSEQVQFSYGPERQRWEQIYTLSSAMEKTYYVGGLMEVVFNGGVATYRHYVNAGAEPVALYSRSGNTNTMSYVLEDHQGSVSTIASSSGAANVTDSFSAFGQLRNSTTWSGTPTSTETNALLTYTRQGYTFQTWLGQSMGLNHTNGRVQDALLTRFLSADLHVTDTTNAQSYNRYSYVLNNPLTMVDPTGFDGDTTNCPNSGGQMQSGNAGSSNCMQALPTQTVVGSKDSSGNTVTTYGPGNIAVTAPDGSIAELHSVASSPKTQISSRPPPPPLAVVVQQLPEIVVKAPYPKRLFGTHWCGPGGGGPPVNDLDTACKAHDQCYDDIGVSASSNFHDLSTTDAARVEACNQLLCDSVRKSNARGSTLTNLYFTLIVNSNVACD
jgi:RHS repeat-associated protein